MRNWKTTLSGIGLIITGVITIATKQDFTTGITSIVAGVGFLFAKDHNVSGV